MVYGMSLIFLYSMSSIYHGLKNITGKKIFRILDHCSVLLLEAGTYTPICICLLEKPWGYILFSLVFITIILAIILNVLNLDKYQQITLICNLLLGWSIIIMIRPLLRVCPLPGVFLLFGGGLSYSFGALLYKLGAKQKYMHSLFHFFVLLGSLLHFLLIYNYII